MVYACASAIRFIETDTTPRYKDVSSCQKILSTCTAVVGMHAGMQTLSCQHVAEPSCIKNIFTCQGLHVLRRLANSQYYVLDAVLIHHGGLYRIHHELQRSPCVLQLQHICCFELSCECFLLLSSMLSGVSMINPGLQLAGPPMHADLPPTRADSAA